MEAPNFSYQPVDEIPFVSKERMGSQAFNLEYGEQATDAELWDDIISYLGEYRLQVKKNNYELLYTPDSFGRYALRDKNRGESMRLKADRSIAERLANGDPIHRETAEEEGLAFLESQLATSRAGDTILWASPPGPKDQGYGDYGFLFYGKVMDSMYRGKHLAMTAIRVEKPTLLQYNNALSELSGLSWQMKHADEFLKSPIVITEDLPALQVDQVLQKNFSFQMNEQERQMVSWIADKLTPAIETFIRERKQVPQEENLRRFHMLENFALALKEGYENGNNETVQLDFDKVDSVEQYNYEPPQAGGSCGSTQSNLFGTTYESIMERLGIKVDESYAFDHEAECVVCKKKAMCGPCDMCEACDLTASSRVA